MKRMNSAFADLADALRQRRAIIADEASRRDQPQHIARLAAVSAKIEELEASLPLPVDGRLAHFLQRRSYDKALEFIENTVRQSTAR
jgi:hypothetical protein